MYGDLRRIASSAEPSSFKYKNYNATINWDAGPFSILSTTSYGILNSDFVTDSTNHSARSAGLTFGDFLGAVIAPGLGGYIDNSADLTKFTQEIRAVLAGARNGWNGRSAATSPTRSANLLSI